MTWQTIDTAPRDGTPILGYYCGGNWSRNHSTKGLHNAVVIYWNPRCQMDIGNPHPWDSFGPNSFMECDISHWMQIPPLPQTKELDPQEIEE